VQAAAYPAGSKVVTGENRRYLIAPLGNLVDERYTSYFEFEAPSRDWHASAAAQRGRQAGRMLVEGGAGALSVQVRGLFWVL
jgi:hypothetical protein